MILKEPNLFQFTQLKHHAIRVDTELTDSINDTIIFYFVPTKKRGYDYVITDDGYSLDSPVLYSNKDILSRIIKEWNNNIVFDKMDDIKEYATSKNLNTKLINFLHTLIFAQGVDYLLCHLSGESGNKLLSPVVVARKLDGLKNAVEKKHLKRKDLPGLINNVKKGLSI